MHNTVCTVSDNPPNDWIWFDDAIPTGASPTAPWTWDNSQIASGTQSVLLSGTGTTEAQFTGSTETMALSSTDMLFAHVMLDPCDPPKEIALNWYDSSWNHRAYWGADLVPGLSDGGSKFSMGPIPPRGSWVRLQAPVKILNNLGGAVSGMTLSIYDGKAWIDRAGKFACTTPTAPQPTYGPNEVVWFDDSVPAGASIGGEWQWDTSQSASGTQSHTHPARNWKVSHWFDPGSGSMTLAQDDDLFLYVLIDPCNPAREISVNWYDGSWEHRTYWGEDLIDEQARGTNRFYMGPLPPAGVWTKLSLHAAFIGMGGHTIRAAGFDTYAGKVWFDRVGKTVGGTASLLRRKRKEPQYAFASELGRLNLLAQTLPAMSDSDDGSEFRHSFSMVNTDTGEPLKRYFLYTPELNLLAETELTSNAAPATQYDYVWFGGQPVAQFNGNTTYWTFDDHLGTPILQTNSTGAVAWRAEYEPYGEVYSQRVSTNMHQPLRFPGQEAEQLDSGTNGVTDRRYNVFRWYRAAWGQYTQFDPIGNSYWPAALAPRLYSRTPAIALPELANPARVQPFTYGADNPIRTTDANGMRVQTRGCDPPANCLEANKTRPCCDCHDVCFATYNCSAARDWAETASYLAAIATPFSPPIPPPPCVMCNLWVMNCFVNAAVPNSRSPRCPWPEMPGTWPPNSSGPPWN